MVEYAVLQSAKCKMELQGDACKCKVELQSDTFKYNVEYAVLQSAN